MLHLLQFPDLGFLLYLKLELRLQEQGRVAVQESPCACLSLLWLSVREAAPGQKPRHCRGCGLWCQALSRKGHLRFHFYHQCWERQKGKRARFHETVATLGIPGFSFRKSKHACPWAVSHWPAADYLRSVSLSLLQEHPPHPPPAQRDGAEPVGDLQSPQLSLGIWSPVHIVLCLP